MRHGRSKNASKMLKKCVMAAQKMRLRPGTDVMIFVKFSHEKIGEKIGEKFGVFDSKQS
jgi:hypothetical protein